MKKLLVKKLPVEKLLVKKQRAFSALPGVAAVCLAVAGCVPPPPEKTPAPSSRPVSRPAPAPTSIITAPENWMDAPATPGDWSYRLTSGGSQALFGNDVSGTQLTLQCSRDAGQVLLVRRGDATGPVPMRILTETESRAVTGTPDRGAVPSLVVSIATRDQLLDAMAISKGRFAVETPGLPTIYAPSWPEITRVIEDCR